MVMKAASDAKIKAVPEQLSKFLKSVLYDEEPLFISDEATIYDLSMSDTAEISDRIQRSYGIDVTTDEIKLPLWKLLDLLERRRHAS